MRKMPVIAVAEHVISRAKTNKTTPSTFTLGVHVLIT